MRSEAALGLSSLRVRVPTSSEAYEAHYGLMRYDALGTGAVALVGLNLGAHSSTVELDLSGLPPQLIGQKPTNLLQHGQDPPALTNHTPIDVGGHGYAVLVGLRLPRWAPQGYLFNCSASYAPPALDGVMPLQECLIACLHDVKCDAVSVDWVQKYAWPKPAQMPWYGNQVVCRLRGGVDLPSCAKDGAALPSHSTIALAAK